MAILQHHRRSGAGRNPDWQPCVYLLASERNSTLYLGVTSKIVQRVWQHKNGYVEGFSRRYGAHLLVWYVAHGTMESAIFSREDNQRLERGLEDRANRGGELALA